MNYSNPNNIWNTLELCLKKVSETKTNIERNKYKKETSINSIIELYQFIKNISKAFYIDEKMHSSYKFIIDELLSCECYLQKHLLTNINTNFSYENNIELNNSENKILDYIVHLTRKYIVEINSCKDFNKIDLTNNCKIISEYVHSLCTTLGIQSKLIKLSPGFCDEASLLDGHGYHYFNLITINNKDFIIDCTYSQFFNLRQNVLQRIGIAGIVSCNPGIYMLMNESRTNTATTLLEQGWIKMTNENIKNYFDGFALSYRNGLYYEQNPDNRYTTNYTDQDYLNFINNLDNQINHENIETLGIQKRPLQYHL